MKVFSFIDDIAELKKNESVTASYTLKGNEEFLEDHFQDFPVMPGVLMLESLKQAASVLLSATFGRDSSTYRMASVEEARFGQFVRPGNALKILVRLVKTENSTYYFDGRADLSSGGKALTAVFCLI